ncbi:MAG: dynamin family protein [Kiritimatiellae bacterium]|nr:dynamin family protein [Kiritimatiellia bacterium]
MKTDIPEDIITKFQSKYDWLKRVQLPSIGKPDAVGIYRNPDGGFQQWFDNWVSIVIRPGIDQEPHEVHGAICARWSQEGGAWNEKKERGWLGYPISDEEAYNTDGDPSDRISHFENGDVIWTAKNNETRIVKRMNTTAALNPKRREIIKPLEDLRGFVKRPINGLTDSRVADMEKSIDSMKRSVCYDRYRVTVFGAFSAGKSTLLNALMGVNYLPSADLPTTNVTTEIFRSDRFYVFTPCFDITKDQIAELRKEITNEIPEGTFLTDLERDGQKIPGIGVLFQTGDSKGFRQLIEQLASEQSRHETGLSRFKKRIKDRNGTVLQLGIPNLPEWLGEITLTDAPGAGSVYKGHEAIIEDIIPKTQLVLYVVESPKAGSSVDKWLCNRIVNSYRRKVFFVLNKIDQQNNDEIADALAELKEHIPSVKVGNDGEPPPPRPEFLKSSALCETIANQLSDGSLTIKDLASIKKLSLQDLTFSDEWTAARNDDERKNVVIRYLRKQSQFDSLRERIKSYLHEENKELPFCEKAEALVRTCGQELNEVCTANIMVLQTDRSDKELEEKQQELRRQRERIATEARSALEDFRESALKPGMGVLSKVEGELSEIPNAIANKLETILGDNDKFKRFTANKGEELKGWLTKEVSDRMEPISRSLDGELRRQGEHLTERLRPILEKIDSTTLAHQCNSISQGITMMPAENLGVGENADEKILATTVTAGVSGGALAAVLGLTVGVVSSSTTIAGTGLAGWLGTGLFASSTASSIAASYGLGTAASTMVSTAPFWGLGLASGLVIVGLVVAALAIPTIFVARNIIRRKIVEKVKSVLEQQIVGDEDASVIRRLKERVTAFVNGSVDAYGNNLNAYLDHLDKQEKKIIADAAKARDDKVKKVKALETFREELKAFVGSSVQVLRELNPGKDPVHV